MRNALTRLILLCLAAWGLAFGQTDSRTALIEAARAEKAANLTPEKPPRLETRIEAIENSVPYRLLTGESGGFSVGLGNIVPGAGLAAGPQYTRRGLWKGRLDLRIHTRASINQSYLGRFDAALPNLFGERVSLEFSAAHRNISEMPYYGGGPDSRKTGLSNYRLEDTNFELRPQVRVFKGLRASLIGSYLLNNVGPGHATRYISTEQQFGPAVAPGIEQQTNFWRGGGALEYDWRNSRSDPTSGGRYSAQYVRYLDKNLGQYSFLRLDLDATQYLPLFNRTRVIALRGASSLTTTSGNQRVPFYLQPTLGGPDSLRGYRFNRFYGDNSTLASAEYRWQASPILQMVAFADGGKVFNRWEQWNFHNIESDVGFGLRFRGQSGTVLSFDTGFSHEGFQVWFRMNMQ